MDTFSPPPPSDDSSWWLMAPELDDAYAKAAGQIIEKRGAVKPRAHVEPVPPPAPDRPPSLKKTIRRAIRKFDPVEHPDTINAITNRVHRAVKPLLARAYVFGFEAAADAAGHCCGCNVYEDQINPYDGTPL